MNQVCKFDVELKYDFHYSIQFQIINIKYVPNSKSKIENWKCVSVYLLIRIFKKWFYQPRLLVSRGFEPAPPVGALWTVVQKALYSIIWTIISHRHLHPRVHIHYVHDKSTNDIHLHVFIQSHNRTPINYTGTILN